MALISRGYPSKPKPGDMLITLLRELIDSYPEYREYIPEITEDTVRSIISGIGMRVRTSEIVELVMSRYAMSIE